MFGIDDPLIWMAYVSCLLVTLLSVGYGVVRRNQAPDKLTREDRAWAKEEQKVDHEI